MSKITIQLSDIHPSKGVGQNKIGSRPVGRAKDEGGWKMDEKLTNKIRSVRDLKVYRKSFDSSMEKKVDTFCRPSS